MKRLLITIHRYTGVALGLLFVAWFVSGIAMVHYRSPLVDDRARLAVSPAIETAHLTTARAPRKAAAPIEDWHRVETLRLGVLDDRPIHRWRAARGTDITLRARNLTDRQWVTAPYNAGAQWALGDPRSFEVSVRHGFD